jgi:phage terminase small subunit
MQGKETKEKVKLTAKQEMFCKEYIIDLNATQAAIRAGYSKDTATEIGCENLTKPNIQKRISELSKDRNEKLEITAIEVLKVIHQTMLESQADSDRPNTYKGAELLGKHLSLFTDKVDHSSSDGTMRPQHIIIQHVKPKE